MAALLGQVGRLVRVQARTSGGFIHNGLLYWEQRKSATTQGNGQLQIYEVVYRTVAA